MYVYGWYEVSGDGGCKVAYTSRRCGRTNHENSIRVNCDNGEMWRGNAEMNCGDSESYHGGSGWQGQRSAARGHVTDGYSAVVAGSKVVDWWWWLKGSSSMFVVVCGEDDQILINYFFG